MQLGLHIIGPQRVQQKGATTAIDAGSAGYAHRLEERLRHHFIIVSARGKAIRLAPHGFTGEEELEQAMHTLAGLIV
jgi:hypothetical protein